MRGRRGRGEEGSCGGEEDSVGGGRGEEEGGDYEEEEDELEGKENMEEEEPKQRQLNINVMSPPHKYLRCFLNMAWSYLRS